MDDTLSASLSSVVQRNRWYSVRGDSVAWLCAELPVLQRLLRGPASAGPRHLVKRAVAAAKAGEPIDALIAEMDVTAGAPASGHTRGLPTPITAAGSTPMRGAYVCPADTCSRAVVRNAGDELPVCHIHDQALRFVADD